MIEKYKSSWEYDCSSTPEAWTHNCYILVNFVEGLKIKINELVDAVNNQQIQLNNHECRLLDLQNQINEHDQEIDDCAVTISKMEKCETSAENVLTMVDNQVTADLPNIDVGELAFLSKENTELKDEIDRLQTELERTRKALDVAVDALKSTHEYYQNCVIRERQPHEINWYYTAKNMHNDIFNALEQITALEQKDK